MRDGPAERREPEAQRHPETSRADPGGPVGLAACRAGLPERLVAVRERVRRARQDEEEVGEPVQVDGDERAEPVVLRRQDRLTLGAAADRPGDVERRRGRRATREDEALELRQVGVEPVAVLLEPVDERLLDPQPALDLARDGEVGAEVEQLVLDPLERRPDLVRGLARRGRPRAPR